MASCFESENLQEDLNCPVCFKIPRTTPIYQCKEGHIHCKECHPRLQNCPVCRSNILDTRSLIAEKMISKLPLQCIYSDVGCEEDKMTLDETKEHEKECLFRPVKCFVEANCRATFPLCQALDHIRSVHSEDINLDKESSRSINLQFRNDPNDQNKLEKTEWFPQYLSSNEENFICETIIDEHGYFSINVILLGSSDRGDWFGCQVTASTTGDDENMITSKGVINVYGDEKFIPSLTLTPRQIRYMRDEDYNIDFEISITSDSNMLDDQLEVVDTSSTKFIKHCYYGEVDKVRAKLSGPKTKSFDVNARTKTKLTPFIISCLKGHMEIVNLFILNAKRLGIDLNATDEGHWSGLRFAVSEGHMNIVKRLTENDVDIDFNSRSSKGSTPIMIACLDGRIDMVNHFIEIKEAKSIDFSVRDEDGETAFHYACGSKNKDVIKVLINMSEALGLDLDQENEDGETGFDILPRYLRESLGAKRPRVG